MAWTTVVGWPGRVWVDAKGKRTFHIRQVRGGKLWEASTRAHTLKGAMDELARWENNPAGYRPLGSGSECRVVLDAAMIEEYATWCVKLGANTDPKWVAQKKRYLKWWMEQLAGAALASVRLKRILECLKDQPSRADRIKSIKHLYSWLRQTDRLNAAEDPTLDALPVPQARPAQDTGPSKVISEADFRAVLPKLPPVIADICRVQAGTGCHVTEALRFMEKGSIEERAGALPAMCFLHKGGHVHRVEVTGTTAEAARRLLQSAAPGRSTVYHAVERACLEAGVEPWTPGRFRHTFATTAIARGIPAHAVALALGHTGTPTMLRWYATTAVAPRVAGGYAE